MRDGAEGPAVAAAMDLLVRYGQALDAERLCTVRNVAGTTTQPSPVKARLVAEGGWDRAFSVINLDADETLPIPPMAVPTCQLQQGFGPDSVGTRALPAGVRGAADRRGGLRRRPRGVDPRHLHARTRWATSRCAASTAPGWSPRPSSTPTPCSAPAPTARAPRPPARRA